jgi:hypothetical protein
MPPDDGRLREIARILAAGILRLRNRAALPVPENPGKQAESSPNGLEVIGETRLSVHTG